MLNNQEHCSKHCNIGHTDRIVRISAGVSMLTIALYSMSIIWAIFGAILLASGIARVCFVYKLFGFSTRVDSNKDCSTSMCETPMSSKAKPSAKKKKK